MKNYSNASDWRRLTRWAFWFTIFNLVGGVSFLIWMVGRH